MSLGVQSRSFRDHLPFHLIFRPAMSILFSSVCKLYHLILIDYVHVIDFSCLFVIPSIVLSISSVQSAVFVSFQCSLYQFLVCNSLHEARTDYRRSILSIKVISSLCHLSILILFNYLITLITFRTRLRSINNFCYYRYYCTKIFNFVRRKRFLP